MIGEVDEFKRAFDVEVVTTYGMTETGPFLFHPTDGLPNPQACGKVRPGYEVRVVDEFDRPVGPNTLGEMIVRTSEPWMMNSGYWNRAEATAATWRNGWFHTGDGFKYDEDGFFYFVDRLKDTVRARGENISSFEVEALVVQHPDVSEVAAVGLPSPMGEDDLKIFVIPKSDRKIDERELFYFLQGTMPKFMLPRYIELVDEFPRTPNLKVMKRVLRGRGVTQSTWDRENMADVRR